MLKLSNGFSSVQGPPLQGESHYGSCPSASTRGNQQVLMGAVVVDFG